MRWQDQDVRQLALEAGGIGVVVWDLHDGALSWSHGGAALGLAGPSLPTSMVELAAMIHPEDRAEFGRIGAALRSGDEVEPFDVRVVAPDGGARWIRATSRALHDEQERLRWIVTAVMDTSAEHRRVDRAARDAQIDRLVAASVLRFVGLERTEVDRQLGAALSDVAHLLDAGEVVLLRRVEVAPGWEQRARWPGPGDAERAVDVPPRVLDALDRGTATVLRLGDGATTDWLAAPSGAEPDAFALVARRETATDWADADASRLAVLAAACGQTVQRSTMAHELEEAVSTVDQLVASAPIILWRGTTDRHELDTVSPNTQRSMGYPPEVYARRWYELVHPDDVATVDQALLTATREGRGTYVARIQHADGTYRSWQVTLETAGVRGDHGRSVRGYSLDVSAWMSAAPAHPEVTSGPTVLVVEDDPQGREVIASVLRRDGYGVVLASDVAQARAVTSTTPLDLVLTDVALPDGSGFDLLEELRRTRPELAVVLMSGRTVTELAGAADALAKPFSLDQLRGCVERQLGPPSSA